MNNNTFSYIFDSFLTFLKSCTLADLSDGELTREITKFMLRALADFRFPQVSLEYEPVLDQSQNITDYRFIDADFSQREVNVIIAYMKKYFFEWIVSRESNFEQQYYDSDTKTHSQGNLVQQMNNSLKTAIKEANEVNYDYTRTASNRKISRLGLVNDDD